MFSTHLESLIKAVVVILCYDLRSTDAQDFSYDGTMGPEHWGEQYNGCSGKYQSPINIDLLDVVKCNFDNLVLERFDETPLAGDLLNNGHTVIVHLAYDDEEPTISGGPLKGKYRFAQLHFHWGENDTYGSEDQINNQSFPAELHMVFYNTKYGSFDDAVGHSEGVAVMAFFYFLQEEDNPYYADLAFLLDSLQEPDHHVPFIGAPSLRNLGSTEYKKYFTYIGSLTTPPCSEEVLWIDFEEPIKIARSQIEKFRHIYNHAGQPLTHNFRPIQPLNNRVVSRNIVNLKPQIDGEYYSDRIESKIPPSQSEYNFNKATTRRLDRFRYLYTHSGERIKHNIRPIQPLNGRRIDVSNPDYDSSKGSSEYIPRENSMERRLPQGPILMEIGKTKKPTLKSDIQLEEESDPSKNLDRFRYLYTHNGDRIKHNIRPIQPLNGRRIDVSNPDYNPSKGSNEYISNEQLIPSRIAQSAPIPIRIGKRKKPKPDSQLQGFDPSMNISHSVPFYAKRKNSSPTIYKNIQTWPLIVSIFTIICPK